MEPKFLIKIVIIPDEGLEITETKCYSLNEIQLRNLKFTGIRTTPFAFICRQTAKRSWLWMKPWQLAKNGSSMMTPERTLFQLFEGGRFKNEGNSSSSDIDSGIRRRYGRLRRVSKKYF